MMAWPVIAGAIGLLIGLRPKVHAIQWVVCPAESELRNGFGRPASPSFVTLINELMKSLKVVIVFFYRDAYNYKQF